MKGSKIIIQVLFYSSLILISCRGKEGKDKAAAPKQLGMIEVPAMLNDENERNTYIVNHFWDNVDFKDTTYLKDKQALNTHFSAYVQSLTTVPHEKALKSVTNLADRAIAGDPKMMMMIQGLFETGFYNPNSIFRNEELYIAVLEHYINSGKLEPAIKERLNYQLELAFRNRLGTKALNFPFVYADGRKSSLYKISSDYIILIFFDPDCPNCKETMEKMNASRILPAATAKVKVLSMYAGVDYENWLAFSPNLNKKWINGCDKEMSIMNGSLYDMRPAPSLYLLDKNKLVILKDAPFEVIEGFIKERLNLKEVSQ